MKLRSFIFWPHLIAGVTAGLIIFLMCVTGVLLTYERQLIAWADSGFRSLKPAADARPLPLDVLLERARDAHPDLTPDGGHGQSRTRARPLRSLPASARCYVDRYSGSVVGEASRGGVRKFMADLRAWHRWLAVEGDGRPVGARDHRLVQLPLSVHRLLRHLSVVPAEMDVGAGPQRRALQSRSRAGRLGISTGTT